MSRHAPRITVLVALLSTIGGARVALAKGATAGEPTPEQRFVGRYRQLVGDPSALPSPVRMKEVRQQGWSLGQIRGVSNLGTRPQIAKDVLEFQRAFRAWVKSDPRIAAIYESELKKTDVGSSRWAKIQTRVTEVLLGGAILGGAILGRQPQLLAGLAFPLYYESIARGFAADERNGVWTAQKATVASVVREAKVSPADPELRVRNEVMAPLTRIARQLAVERLQTGRTTARLGRVVSESQLLGRILVDKGFATVDQVTAAQTQQEAEYRQGRVPQRLGAILVGQKVLRPKQLSAALADLRVAVREQVAQNLVSETTLLGMLAMKAGLLKKAQVRTSLEKVKEGSLAARPGAIFVELGLLRPGQVRKLRDTLEQKRTEAAAPQSTGDAQGNAAPTGGADPVVPTPAGSGQ